MKIVMEKVELMSDYQKRVLNRDSRTRASCISLSSAVLFNVEMPS